MMIKTHKSEPHQRGLIKYTWWIIAVWTLILLGLLSRDLNTLDQTTQNLVIREARTHLQKDKAFRFWASTHGGFYVPIDKRTPPNPYLSHVFERDIETPSGVQLTLMNPAYALRQMNEDFAETYGIAGHITSLLPLRPENTPDVWEQLALKSFESGETEVIEFTEFEGQPFMRMMRPLICQEGCLKCHAHQGYKVGDVRGGVSVSIPLVDYLTYKRKSIISFIITYAIIWILGCGIIIKSFLVVKKNNFEREYAQKMLQESYGQLEIRVQERTDKLAQTNQELLAEITERKRADEELKKHRDNMEEMIEERTKELEDKNKELNNNLKVFVGREQKIRELEMRLKGTEGE